MSRAHITQRTNLFCKQNMAPKSVLRTEIPTGPPKWDPWAHKAAPARSQCLHVLDVKLHFGSSEAGLLLKSVGLS